jgi:hypothetical protein
MNNKSGAAFLLSFLLFFSVLCGTFPSCAASASSVLLKADRVEYSESGDAFTVYASVCNFSSVTIPECSMVFGFPDREKNGLELENAGNWNWIGATPADSDITEEKDKTQITLIGMEPGEAFSFSFSGRAGLPETDSQQTVRTGIHVTIDLRDDARPEWGGEAESVIPLLFHTLVDSKPEESPAEETKAPEKTVKKKVRLSDREYGSADNGDGQNTVIYVSEKEAETESPLSAAENRYGGRKEFPAEVGLVTAAALIVIGLIIKYTVRCVREHKRKFHPRSSVVSSAQKDYH